MTLTIFAFVGYLIAYRLYGRFLARKIFKLSDENLMILQATTTSKSDFAKAIYQRYRRISAMHNERPFSYVYFYSNLSYLQSMGLVALIATKVGRTYANRVMLTFDSLVLETVFKRRFSSFQAVQD